MGNIDYYRKGEQVEIIVRDPTQKKIDTFKCNVHEKKKYNQILSMLKEKYGFEPIFVLMNESRIQGQEDIY